MGYSIHPRNGWKKAQQVYDQLNPLDGGKTFSSRPKVRAFESQRKWSGVQGGDQQLVDTGRRIDAKMPIYLQNQTDTRMPLRVASPPARTPILSVTDVFNGGNELRQDDFANLLQESNSPEMSIGSRGIQGSLKPYGTMWRSFRAKPIPLSKRRPRSAGSIIERLL